MSIAGIITGGLLVSTAKVLTLGLASGTPPPAITGMPHVVGLEWHDALTAMISAGVREVPLLYFQADPVTIIWERFTTVRPGFVAVQNPGVGAYVAVNGPVTLTVSSHPLSVSVEGGSQS